MVQHGEKRVGAATRTLGEGRHVIAEDKTPLTIAPTQQKSDYKPPPPPLARTLSPNSSLFGLNAPKLS